jgi:mono-ADP-ribosyltransferase sirtuin 6
MALVGLVSSGVVKLVISQNVDGLHLRSGIPREKLAELHGNLFLETCEVCGWEYLRDFDVGGISFQTTGRFCTRSGCGGALRDTLLDWDDSLPEADFLKAQTALGECDLCLCMGTSLRIRPASELPLISVRNGGKLVICNLQNTPKDRHAWMNIHAPVDDTMSGVMALLSIPIPPFERHIELLAKVQSAFQHGLQAAALTLHASAGENCAVPLVQTCNLEIDQELPDEQSEPDQAKQDVMQLVEAGGRKRNMRPLSGVVACSL